MLVNAQLINGPERIISRVSFDQAFRKDSPRNREGVDPDRDRDRDSTWCTLRNETDVSWGPFKHE